MRLAAEIAKRQRFPYMKLLRLVLLSTLSLALTAVTSRSTPTYTWTGLGANNDTTVPSNWLGGSAPSGSGGEDLFFGDSPRNAPRFTSNFTAQDITLSASQTGYSLTGVSNPTLTVTGDVSSIAGSGPSLVFSSSLTLSLAAGGHNFDVQGGDIYILGTFAGSGDIVKTGSRSLVIANADDANTYTGNITLSAGQLSVAGNGALGANGSAGILALNGGRLSVNSRDTDRNVTLYNDVSLGASPLFGVSSTINFYYAVGDVLRFAGNTDTTGSTISINRLSQVYFDGNVTGTSLLFSGGGGTAILNGTNTYTGGTSVTSGTVIFMNSVPGSGALKSTGSAYLGSAVTTNLQTGFLDLFNKGATTGIVGFDSPDAANPAHFAGPINLVGFNSAARLGTATAAILDGTITPQSGDYQFGGRGTLTVTSNLTGSGDVEVSNGLRLFLSGTNTYTGETEAVSGAIIFTGPNSIPGGADLYADTKGYIGQTESAGVPTAAAYFALFYTPDTFGVVGFDADGASRIVSDNMDFSIFDHNAFLGTASNVTFTGTITPFNQEYRFTGFRDGHLTVSSTLSGTNSVVIGLDGNDISSVAPAGQFFSPSVTLTGPNTYSVGTTLQSGELILGDANALGTGTLTINSHVVENQPAGLSTTAPGFVIPNAIVFTSSPHFYIGGANNFTLAGNLTSLTGQGLDKLDANVVTLSGDNSMYNGYFNVRRGDLIFATDTAAGIGSLFLDNAGGFHGRAFFTSLAPAMGSLSGSSGTSLDLGSGTLTINQLNNASYSGVITGAGSLVKDGIGRLSLNGANSYGGNTTILNGTLVAGNNSALRGTVTVNGGTLNVASGVTLPNVVSFGGGGGTLTGNGTFGTAITIVAGTRLSPGTPVGLLSFNSGLTLAPGATFNVEVQTAGGARGADFDSINVTGGLTFSATLGSPLTLNLSSLDATGVAGAVADFDPATNYAWLVAHSDGVTGFDRANISLVSTNFTNSLGGGWFDVSMAGNDLFLSFTPVPEPSTYALLGLGLGAVLFPVLRRRKRV